MCEKAQRGAVLYHQLMADASLALTQQAICQDPLTLEVHSTTFAEAPCPTGAASVYTSVTLCWAFVLRSASAVRNAISCSSSRGPAACTFGLAPKQCCKADRSAMNWRSQSTVFIRERLLDLALHLTVCRVEADAQSTRVLYQSATSEICSREPLICMRACTASVIIMRSSLEKGCRSLSLRP